jgi:hypothetical protein
MGQPGLPSRTTFLPNQSRICVAAAAARLAHSTTVLGSRLRSHPHTTSKLAIIIMSSCSRLWQCKTYLPL